jgi:PAS domain S-box-containing protein
VILLAISVIFFVQSILSRKLTAELQKRGIIIAEHFAQMSIRPLLTDDMISLQILALEFREMDEDTEYIIIFDEHRGILVHTFGDKFPIDLRDVNTVIPGQPFNIQTLSTEQGTIYDIAVPILDAKVGIVRFGISDKTIRGGVSDIIRLIAWTIVVILIIGTAIASFFAIAMTRPISELKNAAEMIGKGNLEHKVAVKTKDEVGQLALTFNKMTESLKKSNDELNRANIELKQEIIERTKAEDALQLSEQRYRTITTTANDAIIMMDDIGNISFWNPAAEKLFGYTKEEVLGKDLHNLLAPYRYISAYQKGIKKFKETGEGALIGKTVELEAIKKDGTEFPVELSLSALYVKNKLNAIGIVRNITDRKSSEEKIIKSLEEKEVLLKEIHHRVKNNMQVISSLLDLQEGCLKEKQSIEIFNESRSRIKAMSLVHEKLYYSEDLAQIDFNDYIDSLVNGLFTLYGFNPSLISVKINAKGVTLGIDTAIPCGLIVNELVSNSLKYAFPKGREGEIMISLKKASNEARCDNEYDLTVCDNGIGLPESLDFEETETLGFQLVAILAEHQLQGRIDLNREKGTEFHIRFKN